MASESTLVPDPAVASVLQRASRAAALLVAGLGAVVVVGWLLGVQRLTQVAEPYVSMKLNAALAFLVAGVSLWLQGGAPSRRAARAGRACALVVALLGGATLVEHAGVELGIDEAIVTDPQTTHGLPGRMAPLTAACFLLLGLGLLLLDTQTRRGRAPAQWLALGASFLALLPVASHLYDVETLYGLARHSQVAGHTMLGLLALSLAVLCAHPTRGLMGSVTNDSQSGFLARRLLPAVVLLPLFLGWLILVAQREALTGPKFGLGLFAVTTSAVLTLLVWLNLVALHRNETQQRLARVVLADREELQTTLLSIGDGVISTDAGGRVVRMNPVAERLTGWSRDAAAGRPLVEVFHTRRPSERAPGARVGGRLMARDGAERPIADSRAPIRDAAGASRGEVLVFRDMTEEVAAQDALRASEARNKAALESALDAIVLMDAAGRVLEWNPAAERTFGWTRDEAIGQGMAELIIPPALRARHAQGLARYLATGRHEILGKRLELPARRKDGTEFPAEVSIVRSTGDRVAFTGFIRDVSEHRRLAEERQRSLRLEVENRQIQEANRLKSEFLANMSHELRTPLNAIIGFAELLHDGEVSPELPEHRVFLGHILTSGQHLLQLINDVLDLAKVEAGKLDFHPLPVDLSKVCGEVLAILRTTAQQKRIPVELEVSPELHDVVADASRLKQVLYNYVSNAIKFTPEGGRVLVRARPEGPDSFRLEVEDTGIGIARADLDRLFVEFQQLDAGLSKQHEGTGLGLALARRLVQAQGGTVGVHSEPGEGSTFHAVLPRRASPERPLPGPRAFPSAKAGYPVVLVVEDDERDQARIISSLTAAGYGVEAASTGAQALEKSRETAFDAVTLGLLLPDMSGLQVLRALRRDGRRKDAPVIVITTVSEEGAVSGHAVHDVLGKPLDGGELMTSLRRAGVPPDAGAVLVVDDDSRALELMAATLGQLGYRTRCASSGRVALDSSRGAPPAAVVLDLVMPGMDGFEFLERFRATPRCRRVPVIIWSVKDLTPAELGRLRASAQGVVHKGAEGGSVAVVDELKAFLAPVAPGGG